MPWRRESAAGSAPPPGACLAEGAVPMAVPRLPAASAWPRGSVCVGGGAPAPTRVVLVPPSAPWSSRSLTQGSVW